MLAALLLLLPVQRGSAQAGLIAGGIAAAADALGLIGDTAQLIDVLSSVDRVGGQLDSLKDIILDARDKVRKVRDSALLLEEVDRAMDDYATMYAQYRSIMERMGDADGLFEGMADAGYAMRLLSTGITRLDSDMEALRALMEKTPWEKLLKGDADLEAAKKALEEYRAQIRKAMESADGVEFTVEALATIGEMNRFTSDLASMLTGDNDISPEEIFATVNAHDAQVLAIASERSGEVAAAEQTARRSASAADRFFEVLLLIIAGLSLVLGFIRINTGDGGQYWVLFIRIGVALMFVIGILKCFTLS